MNRHLLVSALAVTALVQLDAAGLQSRRVAQPRQTFGQVTVVSNSEGLQQPESVLYDAANDVYLVANINGDPSGKDDNGFISRVSPEGKVLALKWIDGAAGDVTLHAPKGMAFPNNLLLVADIDTIRLFDRNTGKPGGAWPVTGATFLNDVAVSGNGTVYATDTAMGSPANAAIFEFASNQKQPTPLAKGDALGAPNGIVITPEGPVFVTFSGNRIVRLRGSRATQETVATLPAGQLDGIERLGDGSYVVTSWEAQGVFHVTPDGKAEQFVKGLEGPADLAVDTKRNRIVVPQLLRNEIYIGPVK